MKYVALTGGLGNQLFIYAFCEELRARGHKTVLFIQHRTNLKKYGHQGYELEKLFAVQPYDGFLSRLQVTGLMLYSHLLRVFPPAVRPRLFAMVGVHPISVAENFIFYPKVFNSPHLNELFRGTWQSERFFANAKQKVRERYTFRRELLNEKSRRLAEQINHDNASVSIHIRRGDYLSDQYVNGFAGVCTPEYYARAIETILQRYPDAGFYVFTDDPTWVNANFPLRNACYVQHNTGTDSWQDMYLMSQCKHNIIANSSFSWWGAWLNANPDKTVIAPARWWRLFEKDNVVPEEWIRL